MRNISAQIKKKWKSRKAASHKGDFGRVFILAGSRGFTGAAHLAAQGALRAGAGLITLGVPEAVYSILARKESEVMVRPFPSTSQGTLALKGFKLIEKFLRTQDVLAIGPGLSQNRETQALIRKIVKWCAAPVVLDADGINAFKGFSDSLKKCKGPLVLTPHPGEFKRVFGGKLGTADAERTKRAVLAARKFSVAMVLKGRHTVVAFPEGRSYLNKTGNPGMASGGTGDVLTGIIAALLGQKFSVTDAACFGVYLHGLAGDQARIETGEVSLTAGDLLDALPAAIKKVRGR